MREIKILPNLIGRSFGLDPEGPGSILVSNAIDVSEFCSREFLAREDKAVIEFAKSPNGDSLLHLKTLFKNCGIGNFLVSEPYAYFKIGKEGFRKFLQSSSRSFLEIWGISSSELTELAFRAPPVSMVTDQVSATVELAPV